LLRAEATLLQSVAHQVTGAIVGTDLTEQPVVGDGAIRDRVAPIAQLRRDLRLGFSQHIWILLQNLDNVLGRKVFILSLLGQHYRPSQHQSQRQCET
jgi:hypothetical protein